MEINLKPNEKKVNRFLSLLWEGAEGVLSIVSIEKGVVNPSFINMKIFPGSIQSLVKQAKEADLYHCMGLLRDIPQKGRGTEADVIAIPGLWFDLDCKEGKHNIKDLPSKEEAEAFIKELPLPSVRIWSGGGYHLYWIFKEPLYFHTDQERQSAKDLSSHFQKSIILRGQERGWKLDNTSDLVRLLRLPGTYNHKREPVLVEIVEESRRRYYPHDFDGLITDRAKDKTANIADLQVDSLPLSIALKKLIREGVSPGERSEAGMSVITSLIKAGMSDDHIIQIFEDHPEGIGQKYHEKGSGRDKWIRDEIQRAREKFSGDQRTDDRSAGAKKQYPRRGFPWEVLPDRIAKSLQQVARSCASSPTSLPGAAAAIFSSVIGSTVSVSPKTSWEEPLIIWISDIRPSGSGKTPAARMLCGVLYHAQSLDDANYEGKLDLWESQNRKDRGCPPPRPRGYFVTNHTLEGLRSDHSGHGGKVLILDELSSFISSQNEYKQKGSDRESWLCLHDGKPARIVRAKEAITLSGSRVSIFGGVQPTIWKKAFSQEDQIYLQDGTIYRFLPTYEGDGFYPLTDESWSDHHRESWESLLRKAMGWADQKYQEETKLNLLLSSEAQIFFLNWRNDLVLGMEDLPVPVRGFIPKLVGYALRWSGVLYLMDVFSHGNEPGSSLSVEDVEKGIKVSEFYLGHILVAMEAIQGPLPEVVEVTDQVIHLAKVLKSLEPDVDNSMLAIGYVREKFNESCEAILKVRSPHLMGSILRRCGLTTTAGKHKANDRTGVFCLVWDKKINLFLESCQNNPTSPQSEDGQGF